jgi:hypothetical protein
MGSGSPWRDIGIARETHQTSAVQLGFEESRQVLRKVKKRREGKAVTYAHIIAGCKAFDIMHDAGVPENLAIRSLRDMINVYASEVHHGREVVFSAAARGLPKSQLILEHGTPRTELTRLFLKAYHADELTDDLARNLMLKHWDIVHISREEDLRLNSVGLRSKLMESPLDRWKMAGIEF